MPSTKIYKHQRCDKYDAYVPGKPGFIHDDYFISKCSESFHLQDAYIYRERGIGWTASINKKLYYASSHGINVDSISLGKSDQ